MAKKLKEEAVKDVTTEQPTQTSVEDVTLTLNDLQLIAQVVDLASSRGAFRAAEFEQVGAVYTKLTAFLKHVSKAQEKTATEETAEAVQ